MTNAMIISNAMELNNIREPVDTYQGWKRRGMQVKKGSKALFKTSIWKPCKVKAEAEDDADAGEVKREQKLILVPASFFGVSQVEVAAGAQ